MRKTWTAILLLLLLAPAFAAVTVTMNYPQDNYEFNNLYANRRDIDINFTVTDNNTAVRDLNLNIIYYVDGALDTAGTTIVSDANIFDWNANATATQACVGTDWTSFTCRYHYAMPNETVWTDGSNRKDDHEHSIKNFKVLVARDGHSHELDVE